MKPHAQHPHPRPNLPSSESCAHRREWETPEGLVNQETSV